MKFWSDGGSQTVQSFSFDHDKVEDKILCQFPLTQNVYRNSYLILTHSADSNAHCPWQSYRELSEELTNTHTDYFQNVSIYLFM